MHVRFEHSPTRAVAAFGSNEFGQLGLGYVGTGDAKDKGHSVYEPRVVTPEPGTRNPKPDH